MTVTPIIVIDSREQKPFRFSPGIETVTAALKAADYSLLGLEDDVAIERKSLSDLLGSITPIAPSLGEPDSPDES